MVENINFFIINLILDFSIIEMVNLFLKLYVSKVELFAIVIFATFPTFFYLFFMSNYFCFICLKLLDYLILTLLLTDKYTVKKVFELYFIMTMSLFSVYGFSEFFISFTKNIILDIFSVKLDVFYDFIILFALFLYIFLLVCMFGNITKKREIQNFLFDVSFLLFNNHIEITGFLDSGNTLYDTKTGKCVVVVSLDGIKRYLSKIQYQRFLLSDYGMLGITNELECQVVGGKKIHLPIIDVGEIELTCKESEETRTCKCVIGITKERFAENEQYECLLHREFL